MAGWETAVMLLLVYIFGYLILLTSLVDLIDRPGQSHLFIKGTHQEKSQGKDYLDQYEVIPALYPSIVPFLPPMS